MLLKSQIKRVWDGSVGDSISLDQYFIVALQQL